MSKEVKNTPPKKMNASQKLEAIESLVIGFQQQIEIIADDLDKQRSQLTSLSKRVNASIKATNTEDSVGKIITESNVEDLKGKIQVLIDQGVLKRNDESEVGDKNFVVGREIDAENNVVNPRLQFAVSSLPEDLKSLVSGHKLGDLIKPKEADGLTFEVTEVYDIVDPNIDKKFDESNPDVVGNEAPAQ